MPERARCTVCTITIVWPTIRLADAAASMRAGQCTSPVHWLAEREFYWQHTHRERERERRVACDCLLVLLVGSCTQRSVHFLAAHTVPWQTVEVHLFCSPHTGSPYIGKVYNTAFGHFGACSLCLPADPAFRSHKKGTEILISELLLRLPLCCA